MNKGINYEPGRHYWQYVGVCAQKHTEATVPLPVSEVAAAVPVPLVYGQPLVETVTVQLSAFSTLHPQVPHDFWHDGRIKYGLLSQKPLSAQKQQNLCESVQPVVDDEDLGVVVALAAVVVVVAESAAAAVVVVAASVAAAAAVVAASAAAAVVSAAAAAVVAASVAAAAAVVASAAAAAVVASAAAAVVAVS